jgi:ATP-dependent helicase HepA
LGRDDLGFLTWDHPVVRSALDLLLGSEAGNSAYGVWKHPAGEAIFLEIHTVVECIAPAALHVDRFLPATPIRVMVDHGQNDLTEDQTLADAKLEKADIFRLLDRGAVKKKLFPAMLKKAQELAAEKMTRIVEGATGAMEMQLQHEIERLEELQQLNDHIRPEEIDAVRKQKEELRAALATAQPRLDALKLIFRMPA